MHEGVSVAARRRASLIGVAAVAGVMAALSVASFSHAQRAEPSAAALASEASGQRGDSIVRAHSASEDARERADDTRPQPGSSARAALASEASDQRGNSFKVRAPDTRHGS